LRENRLKIVAGGGRCRNLIDSFLEQETSAKDPALPHKVSHTKSDRVSSSIDALRYVCWGIFNLQKPAVLVSGGGMLA
jgi:hypothetical protein